MLPHECPHCHMRPPCRCGGIDAPERASHWTTCAFALAAGILLGAMTLVYLAVIDHR